MGVVIIDDGMRPMDLDIMAPRAMQPWSRKRPCAARSPACVSSLLSASPSHALADSSALAVRTTTSGRNETKPTRLRPALSCCASWRPAKRPRVTSTSPLTSPPSLSPAPPQCAPLGSPRSLQFALCGLSSLATQRVLYSLHALPSELRHLHGSAPQIRLSRVHRVSGWRHLVWPEDAHAPRGRVVWKSAKALEATRMRALARQLWSQRVGRRLVLHHISDVARVVRCPRPSLSQNQNSSYSPSQTWVECFLDDGRQVCVVRKELRGLHEASTTTTAEPTECQGFLVRPVYARTDSAQELGCTLQSLRAVSCSSRSTGAIQRRLIEELPRFTRQWEAAHLADVAA